MTKIVVLVAFVVLVFLYIKEKKVNSKNQPNEVPFEEEDDDNQRPQKPDLV